VKQPWLLVLTLFAVMAAQVGAAAPLQRLQLVRLKPEQLQMSQYLLQATQQLALRALVRMISPSAPALQQ
jgi:hypothetical protein